MPEPMPNPAPLPENVVAIAASQRSWGCINVGVTEFRCAGPVLHHLGHDQDTRLSVVLEESGGQCEPRLRKNQPCPVPHMPKHMHFAPAGLEVWGYTAGVRLVKDATLRFDVTGLGEHLAEKFDLNAVSTPKLRFADERIWTLVKLLSEAVDDTDPSAELYGDGLTAAIISRVLAAPTETARSHTGLSPWQLRRVVDYLEHHLPQRVELAKLASLAGLSSSHFSRAFKASTGMAPYRWQLHARVRRAQALLLDTPASLDHVAEATGFADAVHFGHTFRKLTGATPTAWRRDRKT